MLTNIDTMDIVHFIIYFLFYSFSGWCVEVLYAYKNQRRFVNRGFLNGPFCPIYGFCMLSIVLFLDKFNGNIFMQFIIATLLSSAVEYYTGFLLERIFKTKYWDYSMDPFNLNGRICLHFSLMWGAVSLAVVRIIHPLLVNVVNMMPYLFVLVFCYFIVSIFSLDIFKTTKSFL